MRTALVVLGMVMLATAVAPSAAVALRAVEVGEPIPPITVDDGGGKVVTVPARGRVTVVVFWRPGQGLSDGVLADLAALASEFARRGVDVVVLADDDASASGAPARIAGPTVRAGVDHGRRAADAYGVVVLPTTAVIRADGRLAAYLPSRPPAYRELLVAHVAHARGELTTAQLAARVVPIGETVGERAEVQAVYRRAVTLARAAQWHEAAAAFTEIVAGNADDVDARVQLGHALLEDGQPALALAQFDAALARNAVVPAARVGRGIALLRLGRTEEAIRLLEEAVEVNPEPVRAHRELARAYEARGDLERALEHYRWAYRKLRQGRK
jgi:thioredoxin-like negative regulator of GroEL